MGGRRRKAGEACAGACSGRSPHHLHSAVGVSPTRDHSRHAGNGSLPGVCETRDREREESGAARRGAARVWALKGSHQRGGAVSGRDTCSRERASSACSAASARCRSGSCRDEGRESYTPRFWKQMRVCVATRL